MNADVCIQPCWICDWTTDGCGGWLKGSGILKIILFLSAMHVPSRLAMIKSFRVIVKHRNHLIQACFVRNFFEIIFCDQKFHQNEVVSMQCSVCWQHRPLVVEGSEHKSLQQNFSTVSSSFSVSSFHLSLRFHDIKAERFPVFHVYIVKKRR